MDSNELKEIGKALRDLLIVIILMFVLHAIVKKIGIQRI